MCTPRHEAIRTVALTISIFERLVQVIGEKYASFYGCSFARMYQV